MAEKAFTIFKNYIPEFVDAILKALSCQIGVDRNKLLPASMSATAKPCALVRLPAA
jgi:hypothetical protein